MTEYRFKPLIQRQEESDPLKSGKRAVRIVRSGVQIGHDLKGLNPRLAVQHSIEAGLKLASSGVFYDALANPLALTNELKIMGEVTLTWAPEVLMAEIDRKYQGWTDTQVTDAIESFHKEGFLKTAVPELVRQKIYAIRVIATSNGAQSEWNIFEKIGAAFNDRLALFGEVQQMSATECARTIACIENIRPEEYSEEVKIYIAACAHEDGLYTVESTKWLKFCESYLQQMNSESSGEPVNTTLKQKILQAYEGLRARKEHLAAVEEDVASIQAVKLLAIDASAEEVIHG